MNDLLVCSERFFLFSGKEATVVKGQQDAVHSLGGAAGLENFIEGSISYVAHDASILLTKPTWTLELNAVMAS